jgi:ribosome biogenesis GTPase
VSRRRHDLDEDDVRVRPGRGSRPRTRTRPSYEDAVDAFVVAVDRGRYTCRAGDAEVVAVRGGDVRRSPVVVGDRVSLVGDVSGRPDTLARVVRVAERTSLLRRTPDDTDPIERPVVANAELLVVVVALADPEPRFRLIDRCLVAAYDGGLTPLLCLTKTDLAPAAPFTERYAPLGVPVVESGRHDNGAGVAALADHLHGRISVAFGHSGVGKSTLVNALVPDAARATGAVTEVGKGRHTSTSVVALRLPGDGWIVDTPGVRSFGLAHVTADDLLESFDDLLPATADCPPGCDHHAGGIGCALDDLVARGEAPAGRLASFRRLLASRGDGAEAAGGEPPGGAGSGAHRSRWQGR